MFLEPWKVSGGACGSVDSDSGLASWGGPTRRDHHRNNGRS